MVRYFETVSGVLESHGGTVEKFIGDAVMAVFGVPAVHEDDALRAVRSATEVQKAIEKLNAELEAERGVRIQIHTGVNSGEVFVGGDIDEHTLVTGDAVNQAARLQQAAGPGEILIGDATYRLARDAVVVEKVDSFRFQGKDDQTAWLLVDVVEGAPSFARRLDTPLVGRARELAHLRLVFERVVEERTNCLFTILGPAGIGKSRLALELAHAFRRRQDRLRTVPCIRGGNHVLAAPGDRPDLSRDRPGGTDQRAARR